MILRDVTVVGAGTVGAATGRGLAAKGHRVTFIDTDERKVSTLRTEGHRADTEIRQFESDAVFLLCLPTNVDRNERYNLEPLKQTLRHLLDEVSSKKKSIAIAIRSTVFPGTVSELIRELGVEKFIESGAIQFAYAPEFLRQAHADADFASPRVTVVASPSAQSRDLFADLLRAESGELLLFPRYEEGELMKLAHNLVNVAEITLWNQIAEISGLQRESLLRIKSAINISAEAKYNPDYAAISGQPIGGPCLPKDLVGAIGAAKAEGLDVSLLEGLLTFNKNLGLEI